MFCFGRFGVGVSAVPVRAHGTNRAKKSLFYREAGDPSSHRALVLLHGSPLASSSWLPQITALAKDFYVMAPDLPMHGQSADIHAETIDEVVDILAETIKSKIPRSHVVGAFAALSAWLLVKTKSSFNC